MYNPNEIDWSQCPVRRMSLGNKPSNAHFVASLNPKAAWEAQILKLRSDIFAITIWDDYPVFENALEIPKAFRESPKTNIGSWDEDFFEISDGIKIIQENIGFNSKELEFTNLWRMRVLSILYALRKVDKAKNIYSSFHLRPQSYRNCNLAQTSSCTDRVGFHIDDVYYDSAAAGFQINTTWPMFGESENVASTAYLDEKDIIRTGKCTFMFNTLQPTIWLSPIGAITSFRCFGAVHATPKADYSDFSKVQNRVFGRLRTQISP